MIKEDKELLLQDLCGRIPHGVKMKHIADTENNPITLVGVAKTMITIESSAGYETSDIEDYIPYLFPMSSMTEEQKVDMIKSSCGIGSDKNVFDWFNKNHFDYRCLIPMGLAIDATDKKIY